MLFQVVLSLLAMVLSAISATNARAEKNGDVQIVSQLGHSETPYSIAIAHDGRIAISAGGDKTLKIWDLITGREIRTIKAHAGVINSIAIAPGGTMALSGSKDQTLKLWDLATGRNIRTFRGHTETITSVAISPDGKKALSGGEDKTLRLWDLATGREVRTFKGHSKVVSSVAITPDGKSVLSSSEGGVLILWDLFTGREIRRFSGHSVPIFSISVSPDGRTALSGGGTLQGKGEIKLWDLRSGREIRSLNSRFGSVSSVAISPDGAAALTSNKRLQLWDLTSGREIRVFSHNGSSAVKTAAFSPDGRSALASSYDKALRLWDLATGLEKKILKGGNTRGTRSIAVSPDGMTALSGGELDKLELWDLTSGRLIRAFKTDSYHVLSVAISPDGKTALSGGSYGKLQHWDLATGKEIRAIRTQREDIGSVAFSPDGKRALTGGFGRSRLWDLESGLELRTFKGHSTSIQSVAISPDGKTALTSDGDFFQKKSHLKLWDLESGREISSLKGHTFAISSVAFLPDGKSALSSGYDGTLRLWNLTTGRQARVFKEHPGLLYSVAVSPDGKMAISGGDDNALRLWDLATGRVVRTIYGHAETIMAVAFSPNGKTALSGGDDGTMRILDIERGEEMISMLSSTDGEQIAITPKGFFIASRRDSNMIALARGFETTTIGQVHQSLYNPDLVREALAHDPTHEVKRAADVISLERVLDSGPTPDIEITSHVNGSRSDSDLVRVAARIKDRGKGIGRIEWRVNNITTGVSSAPANLESSYSVERELALDPGENVIEVVAYEARNLLASLPAQTTITFTGPADTVKPKLHVLAIGINNYVDMGSIAPGESKPSYFPKLGLAVGDAKALAAELKIAGAALYSEVRVRTALDEEASAANLDVIVTEFGAAIHPRDTFVLFAAAHGYSNEGRFYLIPQDYQGGLNADALKARAVGQFALQDWIVNRIKARKALILLDTCESGALTSGYLRSRVDGPASEAGVGRLHEATGRPVVTAAAQGQSALEFHDIKHGIFTAALIDGLRNAHADQDGVIMLSSLVAHVQQLVPKLLDPKVRETMLKRGSAGEEQTVRFGSRGEDFAVARRMR